MAEKEEKLCSREYSLLLAFFFGSPLTHKPLATLAVMESSIVQSARFRFTPE